MNYTTEERIAFLEEMVAMQSEQINRLQQCVNAMVEYSNLSDDRQSEIVNVLCGDNNEFIVNPKPLFPKEKEDNTNEFGDIALSFEELEKKYGKLTFSEEHKDYCDADGFVRRICNISHNEFFASNMAKGEINVNDASLIGMQFCSTFSK
jgi:hypothetical protein